MVAGMVVLLTGCGSHRPSPPGSKPQATANTTKSADAQAMATKKLSPGPLPAEAAEKLESLVTQTIDDATSTDTKSSTITIPTKGLVLHLQGREGEKHMALRFIAPRELEVTVSDKTFTVDNDDEIQLRADDDVPLDNYLVPKGSLLVHENEQWVLKKNK